MSTTFGQLKSSIRGRVWPPGSGEPDNLVASHDKDFVDALVDLQTWVPCLQQDNTDIIPQCATTYNCGMTVLPCPRGIVKKLSIIDKIDPETGRESATSADDYCSEIPYIEVDFCHVRRYLDMGKRIGRCCTPMGLYFGLPFTSYRPLYPAPTDEGVSASLPALPMGYHYPQESTDRTYGRAGAGVWAKERGNIYIAPWIQSTETIIVLWDGIKRIWSGADQVDDDPLLSKAVEEYIRWQHAKKWDRDADEAQSSAAEYARTLQMLIHQCREETRVRNCEPSFARSISTLYYNAEQSYTAVCPSGATGDAVTVTVPAGTVGSSVSVADANQKAVTQARTQAEAQLECVQVYWNTIAYTRTSQGCAIIDSTAPPPQGTSITVTVAVGTVSSTVSVEDANLHAEAQAQANADAGQVCTYSNSQQFYDTQCPDGTNPVSGLCVAGTYTAVSTGFTTAAQAAAQAAANAQALNKARNDANELLEAANCKPIYWNTASVVGPASYNCTARCGPYWPAANGSVTITVDMPADMFSSDIDQQTANDIAAVEGFKCLENAAGYYCCMAKVTGAHRVTYDPTAPYLFVP